MSDEKTFTDAEIEEAIEYLESQGFDRLQGTALEGQMLLTRQADDENVSITVLIHSNNSIKYDVSSGGGDEDYPVEVGEINSLEELHLKVAELIS
jgi:hypothetical protein